METRNFSPSRLAFSWILLFIFAGCQTVSHREGPSVPAGPGPVLPAPPPITAVPLPTPVEAKKVAVILGPGGAKAFAEVGVLRAFQQQRIPIAKVVGLEWGALIAALYADKGQVNDVEWKLYKMEQKDLPHAGGTFARGLGETSIKIMDPFLNDAFQNDDLANAKIPFACPSRSAWTGLISWQTRGGLKDAVRHCLPFPPLFRVRGSFLAGASAASDAIDHLRAEGYNLIILVNVLGSAMPVGQDSLLDNLNYVILWQEVKRALTEASKLSVETVNVDTSSYPMTQFDSKRELVDLGQAAGMKAASALIGRYGF